MTVASRFEEFFRAVHGYSPLPWQTRLADHVVATGTWPRTLGIPTGLGKTSVIDIALFALLERPDVAPRRIVLVVDRRVIVDQAATHAAHVLAQLVAAASAVAQAAADRLRALWGGTQEDAPFEVATLRGGMAREDAWAKRPDRPVVALSTVDQVGSRLLFRGYGVSERMAPIHAGLLGVDTLFLLDEVHLSVPFAETLEAIGERWRPFYASTGPNRWGVVQMSATPHTAVGDAPFELDAADLCHPVVKKRVAAQKRVVLLDEVAVSGSEPKRRGQFAEKVIQAVKGHLADDGAWTVLVVVNRVDSARVIAAKAEAEEFARVVLLTGRMRPIDRDRVVGDLLPLVGASRHPRRAGARPLLVVATQCIEAGADFDFDALVTECASLDALRQRFGRVDRRGQFLDSPEPRSAPQLSLFAPVEQAGHEPSVSHSTIVVRADQAKEDVDDPVYGPALANTWRWLKAQGERLNFGMAGFPKVDPEQLRSLCAPLVHAPILLPAHLDAFAQTAPRPFPDPDVAAWLHGPARGSADVQVVWRSEVTVELLAGGEVRQLSARLDACPPTSAEAITVPLHAVRAWLTGRSNEKDPGISDTLLDAEPAEAGRGERSPPPMDRGVMRWRGDESEIGVASDLRPGDTVIVPLEYGGISSANWDPDWRTETGEPISDLGDQAAQLRGRPCLRLLPQFVRLALGDDAASTVPSFSTLDEDTTPTELLREWFSGLLPDVARRWRVSGSRPKAKLVLVDDWAVLVLLRPRGKDGFATTEDDSASFGGREVTLAAHSVHVRDWAALFCKHLAVDPALTADVALAAWVHDVGKADPRFQSLLAGGDPTRQAQGLPLLAKSGMPAQDAQARRRASEAAGYPRGYRHEVLSVAMIADSDVIARANDRDLVLHLVGSHHGWCRPFAPVPGSGEDVEARMQHGEFALAAATGETLTRLDSGVSDRFWALIERYGWWGLAWLEAILRLADHRASEAEQLGDE